MTIESVENSMIVEMQEDIEALQDLVAYLMERTDDIEDLYLT